MAQLLLKSTLYVSYNQFIVHDSSVSLPGLAWTKYHSKQGFARRSSTENFRTLIPYGDAVLTAWLGGFPENYRFDRAIAVPFHSPSGKVLISAPEEDNGHVLIPVGHYYLAAAQRAVHDADGARELVIELYFQKQTGLPQISRILVADPELSPPSVLLEDAEIA